MEKKIWICVLFIIWLKENNNSFDMKFNLDVLPNMNVQSLNIE